ncbi:MAG: hypothetical protein ACFUZC_16770 [Chthoniobacteraceae bacterium]
MKYSIIPLSRLEKLDAAIASGQCVVGIRGTHERRHLLKRLFTKSHPGKITKGHQKSFVVAIPRFPEVP